jgi:chromosomal replication initiator protein
VTDRWTRGVWAAATNDLNDETISPQKRAYLRLTVLRGLFDDTALLAVPDAFTRDVIEAQLRPAITEALSRHLGRSVQVAVTVRSPHDGTRNALTDPTVAVAVVPVPKAKPHIPESRSGPWLTARREPRRRVEPAGERTGRMMSDRPGWDPDMSDRTAETGPGRPQMPATGTDRVARSRHSSSARQPVRHAAAVAVAESPAMANPCLSTAGPGWQDPPAARHQGPTRRTSTM